MSSPPPAKKRPVSTTICISLPRNPAASSSMKTGPALPVSINTRSRSTFASSASGSEGFSPSRPRSRSGRWSARQRPEPATAHRAGPVLSSPRLSPGGEGQGPRGLTRVSAKCWLPTDHRTVSASLPLLVLLATLRFLAHVNLLAISRLESRWRPVKSGTGCRSGRGGEWSEGFLSPDRRSPPGRRDS